jgi:hypothetical protein
MTINKRINIHQHYFIVCLLLMVLSSCTPLIGPCSPTAYQNATSLKAETLALMDKATQPYVENTQKIDDLNVRINAAYEYVNGMPSNSISAKQWEILKNQEGNLMGKFFSRWKEKGVLSETYVKEFKKLISEAFDEIICLEANKESAVDCGKKSK